MQSDPQRIIFLLGAGFSHAITDRRFPLAESLGKELRGIFPEEIEKKYNFSPEKFELFLTQIDIQILKDKNDSLLSYRKSLIDKILEIFATRKMTNEARKEIIVTKAADKVTTALFQAGDTILTMNYDCYLENVLFKKQKWVFESGWGKSMEYPGDWQCASPSQIRILKLHGSINFVTVPILDGKVLGYSKAALNIKIDRDLFPGCHQESGWEGGISGSNCLILPSYYKWFGYKEYFVIWREAISRIQEADKLVIVGASIRSEDFLKAALSSTGFSPWVNGNSPEGRRAKLEEVEAPRTSVRGAPLIKFIISLVDKKSKIIIIDPNAEKIKEKLGEIPINPANIDPISWGIEDINDEIVNKIRN